MLSHCQWCGKAFLTEEGRLCDCAEDHCEHEFEFLSKLPNFFEEELELEIICSKCYAVRKALFRLETIY
ncbi:MAG: hypothetical protein QW051_05125 [Candidatus Aenigmatarchaeota archaeon]